MKPKTKQTKKDTTAKTAKPIEQVYQWTKVDNPSKPPVVQEPIELRTKGTWIIIENTVTYSRAIFDSRDIIGVRITINDRMPDIASVKSRMVVINLRGPVQIHWACDPTTADKIWDFIVEKL